MITVSKWYSRPFFLDPKNTIEAWRVIQKGSIVTQEQCTYYSNQHCITWTRDKFNRVQLTWPK